MFILQLLLAIVALGVGTVFAIDGYQFGNWNYKQVDLGTRAAPLAYLSPFHVRVTFPTTCETQCGEFQNGGMPVFLFVCGFAGQIDAYNYDTILGGIARHGIIVVAADRTAGYALTLDYSKLGVQFQKVIGWIRSTDPNQGLLSLLQTNGFSHSILNGANRIIFGGHTTGSALVIRNIRDTATATGQCPDPGAVVMINPLDGQDPLGFGGNGAIIKGQNLNFATPSLVIAGSLDPTSPPTFVGLPCTPADRSDLYFFNSWSGASDYFLAQGVGTLDVLTEGSTTSFDISCVKTWNNQSALRTQYRTMVRGAIVNFIQNVVLNNNNYYTLMKDIPPTLLPVTITTKSGSRGFSCTTVTITEGMPFELQTGLILFGFTFALTFITGLYCFFRKMDDDTLHRYHPAEGIGYDQPASFQTKLEPQYGVSGEFANNSQLSFNLNNGSQAGHNNSRTPSINV